MLLRAGLKVARAPGLHVQAQALAVRGGFVAAAAVLLACSYL